MLIKVIISGLIASLGLLLKDCNSINRQNKELFKVDSAYYQTWVINLPDQLIYHFHGERKSYLLQKIEQKSSQFYKVK